jgi:hypothetical protein
MVFFANLGYNNHISIAGTEKEKFNHDAGSMKRNMLFLGWSHCI